jgi:hypothetical protein
VAAGDQDALDVALDTLLAKVRNVGTALPDAELHDSNLILPDAGSTLDEVRSLLNESEEGLIPG